MIDPILAHEFLLAVIIGGLTGRLVDFGAVQLLFRPYRRRVVAGIPLHGVLPARQDALARQLANMISERLLNEDALSAFLQSPDMEAKLRANVQEAVERAVSRELPSIRDALCALFPDSSAIDEEVDVISGWLAEQVLAFAMSEAFLQQISDVISGYLRDRRDATLEALIAPPLFEAFDRFLETVVTHAPEQLPRLLADVDAKLAQMGPLSELLPEETLITARREIHANLPSWLEALETMLRQKESMAWIEKHVLDLLVNLILGLPRQNLFDEFLGWMVRTQLREEDAFLRKKVLESIPDQVKRLREQLNSPDEGPALRKKIDQFLDDLIDVPISQRYTAIPEELRQKASSALATLLESEAAIATYRTWTSRLMAGARRTPLKDVLPPDLKEGDPQSIQSAVSGVMNFAVGVMRGPDMRDQLQTAIRSVVSYLLTLPIGQLRERLGEERLERIHDTLSVQVISLARKEAPRLSRMIDIRSIVEAKVKEADPREIEASVKGLARRELNSIFTKGLYGGIVISVILTTVLLTLEHVLNRFYPGAGFWAIGALGAFLLYLAGTRLRIPEPKA
ncbi:hypothetical protein D3C86_469990 [compost metagenome]